MGITFEGTHRPTNADFDTLVGVMQGLWPTMAKKQLNPHSLRIWRSVFMDFPPMWCLTAIEDYFERSTNDSKRSFFPKPGDIKNILRSKAAARLGEGETSVDARKVDEREQTARRVADSWAKNEADLEELSRQEMLMHQGTLMKQDWRLRIWREVDVEARVWRALIAPRVRKGLGPKDEDPDRQVPREPGTDERIAHNESQLGKALAGALR